MAELLTAEIPFLTPTTRTHFTVTWPHQGVAYFRSDSSELLLSDVYWQWILGEVLILLKQEPLSPIVVAIETGFVDPSNLEETLPVDERFLGVIRRIDCTTAPSFKLLKPSPDCVVPTPQELLRAFAKIATEAKLVGTLEMQID